MEMKEKLPTKHNLITEERKQPLETTKV